VGHVKVSLNPIYPLPYSWLEILAQVLSIFYAAQKKQKFISITWQILHKIGYPIFRSQYYIIAAKMNTTTMVQRKSS